MASAWRSASAGGLCPCALYQAALDSKVHWERVAPGRAPFADGVQLPMQQKHHPTALHSLRVELSLTCLPPLSEVLHHALVQHLPHLIWQMALLEPVDDELREVRGA